MLTLKGLFNVKREKKLLRQLIVSLSQEINDDNQENTLNEFKLLEQFKLNYQNVYEFFSENQYFKYFDRIFALIIEKKLTKKKWLTSCPNENIHLILYVLRILMRDVYFQKYFISNSITKPIDCLNNIFKNFIEKYNKNDAISIYVIILENILNILSKLFTSIENSKFLLNFDVQNQVAHLIYSSKDLNLLHGSLNVLNLVAKYIDNRPKLVDLDLCSQLLIILQEYDDTSKRLAANFLRLMCSEDKIKNEISFLDGLQIFISLLNTNNLEILWNVIWCLVQLSSYSENYKDIRLLGGIPLVLSILSEKYFDSLSERQPSTGHDSLKGVLGTGENDISEERQKWILNIQSACCALIGELALNETNSYTIVNLNGVYLIANKLVTDEYRSTSSHERVETLYCNSLRALRIIYSIKRHRSLIKKILPNKLIEEFVNIGNYKKDLKLYRSLLENYYKLSKEDKEAFKQNVQNLNQNQIALNYINDFAIYEQIGSGGFGRVFKVKKKNTEYFLAMKEINTFNLKDKKDKQLSDIISEVTIIRNNLKHPNIVKYIKTFKEDKNLYIVMELIDGSPISHHIVAHKEKEEKFSEERIWNIFIQIVLALRYLHEEKQIVHRDLTPNNVMLSENDKITITDFGLAKLKDNDTSMKSVVGTLYYSCPEIIKNESYDEKADVWSLGCLLYEMCALVPPFFTSNMLSLATKIANGEYDSSPLDSYSLKLKNTIQKCLTVDSKIRPNIVEVASQIVDKILSYTDSIRFKVTNLEKKLDKEKSRNQRYPLMNPSLSELDLTKLMDSQKSLVMPSSTSSTAAKLPPIGQSSKTKFIMSNKKDIITMDRASSRQQSAGSDNETSSSNRIHRSSSSGAIEKRRSSSAKSRPSSASSLVIPALKKLRSIDDPIVLILEMLKKIIFITQLPPSGKKCIKRKLVDRYKRSLFTNKLNAESIKHELMKLVKMSKELIDNDLLGLSMTQYYQENDTRELTEEQELLKNGITYEILVNFIEDILVEYNYNQ